MSSHHTCLNCELQVGKFLQRCTLGFYIEGTSLEVPMKEDIFIATNWSQYLCFWHSPTNCMCPEQGTHLALHSMKENIGYIAYLTKATPVMALVHSAVYARRLLSSPKTAISERQSTTAAASSVSFRLYFWSSLKGTKPAAYRKTFSGQLPCVLASQGLELFLASACPLTILLAFLQIWGERSEAKVGQEVARTSHCEP